MIKEYIEIFSNRQRRPQRLGILVSDIADRPHLAAEGRPEVARINLCPQACPRLALHYPYRMTVQMPYRQRFEIREGQGET